MKVVALAFCCLSVVSAHSSHTPLFGVTHLRGGADLGPVQAKIFQRASSAIDSLRDTIASGAIVEDFGKQAESIIQTALQQFAEEAPRDDVALYDASLEQLEATIEAPLHVLFLQQLTLARQAALSGNSDNVLQADAQFVSISEASTRPGWDYSKERAHLQSILQSLDGTQRQIQASKMQSAQQQQTAMSFLQSQQQMIQQLQMQLYGQSSPWNVGVAYRIPDTNFNLQGSYQQGRANVQLSCVPDEYAQFLGPNGFTQGVGPGNLGLSLNLSI